MITVVHGHSPSQRSPPVRSGMASTEVQSESGQPRGVIFAVGLYNSPLFYGPLWGGRPRPGRLRDAIISLDTAASRRAACVLALPLI
ncbi:hypothetical protein EVAR_28850_1 [Eumeta japonica]|uniref:Uncharacterized protein n=1 Tax=Eumeta variegata TaxID=151549 RepID=A0A4C1YHS5_EUMVA|nr:hypothetical protein EVAR_28850_1 [Eumeta japonica]